MSVQYLASPMGVLRLWAREGKLRQIEPVPAAEQDFPDAVTEQAASELQEYFAGKRTEFTVAALPYGSAFQQRVCPVPGPLRQGRDLRRSGCRHRSAHRLPRRRQCRGKESPFDPDTLPPGGRRCGTGRIFRRSGGKTGSFGPGGCADRGKNSFFRKIFLYFPLKLCYDNTADGFVRQHPRAQSRETAENSIPPSPT